MLWDRDNRLLAKGALLSLDHLTEVQFYPLPSTAGARRDISEIFEANPLFLSAKKQRFRVMESRICLQCNPAPHLHLSLMEEFSN